MVFTLQTERKKLGEANLPLFIKAHSHEKQSIPEDQHESFLRTVPPVTPLSSTRLHLIGVGIMMTKKYTDDQQKYEKATSFNKENDSQKRHFTCTGKTGRKKRKEER